MWFLTFASVLAILAIFPRTRWIVVLLFATIRDFFLNRKLEAINTHWNCMVEGLSLSPTEFYDALEAALAEKDIPNAHELTMRWSEGGIFSPKRLYFRVARKKVACDICCAPFGNGTFFSFWVGVFPSAILGFFYKIPVLCWLAYGFEKLFRPHTYFHIDSAMMFHTLVHSALMGCVDHYTNEKGLVKITGDERKPKMKDFFSNSLGTV